MQRYVWLAAVLLSLCSGALAWGADAQGKYMLRGLVATHTCAQFLDARAPGGIMDYSMWFAGFLSGLNYALSETFDLASDSQGLFTWLQAYCQQNPLKKFGDAAQALIEILYPSRQTQEPPTQLPPAPGPRPTPKVRPRQW